jgi:nicotinamide-nucleotide adenylyltransferase
MRGLLVGRFQPFHRGHLEVLRHIGTLHPGDAIILGVGSAQESYTASNPFTAAERQEMIARALAESGIPNWLAIPIPDIHRHSLWVSHLLEMLPPFERVYTNNPLTRLLFERENVPVESTPLFDRETLQGTRIRKLMAEGGPWRPMVPEVVARYIDEIDGPARIRMLSER